MEGDAEKALLHDLQRCNLSDPPVDSSFREYRGGYAERALILHDHSASTQWFLTLKCGAEAISLDQKIAFLKGQSQNVIFKYKL
jgi:hypothetical protein